MTKYSATNVSPFKIVHSDKSFEFMADSVSDGHHTMEELYNHRHALFCALVKVYDSWVTPLRSTVKCWKSKLHSDGTMFEGWFIAGIEFNTFDKGAKQITYHLPLEWWGKLKCISIERAPEWDGHDSSEVIKRLLEL